MKTVKTLAEATRLAAQSGATLEVGGRVVNAAGTKMTVVKPRPEPPAPAPAPAEQPMDRMVEIMGMQARIAAAQGQSMSQVMAEIVDRLQQRPPEAPPRPMPTSFDLSRDERTGLISSIVPVYAGQPPAGM